jgi:hypothetical protein
MTTAVLTTSVSQSRIAIGELLVACARARIHTDELDRVRELAQTENLNWELLLKTAADHGVIPILNHSLQRACPDVIPPLIRDRLQRRVQGNAWNNLLMMRELMKLLASMEAQQIRVLPYKGPTLAMIAYGDLSMRQCGDLDILVPKRDIDRAKAILEAHSYRRDSNWDAASEAARVELAHEYDYVYVRKDPAVMVELHWQVMGKLFSFDPDPDDLWTRAAPQLIAGASVRMLEPEDLILILCAHGMKHFWSRLGWLCDIAEYIRNGPAVDWKKLLHRADELRAGGMTLLGLTLIHRVLGAAVPQEVLSHAKRSTHNQAIELENHLFAEPEKPDMMPRGGRSQLAGGSMLQSLIFHVRTRESWGDGLRYCFHRALTPTVNDMSWLRLPRSLRFLYYGLRPIRLGVSAISHAAHKIIPRS